MGFNKVVVLLNDFEGDVNRDPAGWWDRCKNAFYRLQRKQGHPKTFVKEPEHFNEGTAVWEAHADITAVILAGGNCATVLGSYPNGGRHHTEEDQIKVLKDVLDRMGYRIVRKSNRRADSSTKTS